MKASLGLRLILLTSFTLSLTGCGGNKDKKKEEPIGLHQVPTKDLDEATGLLDEAYVNCEDPAKCHPSVGMLAFATDTSAGTCTAWLVDHDLIATNSHCIPNSMRGSSRACQGHMVVLFPSTQDQPDERAECSEVLEFSNYGESDRSEIAQDYAFVRLKSALSRPILPISRDGFTQNDHVRIAKVDPYPNEIAGNLTSVDCDVVKDSLLLSNESISSPFVVVAGCEIRLGNSGSPILDTQGRAHGILHILVKVDQMAKSFGQLLDGPLDPMGIGTSFSCLKSTYLPGSPSDSDSCQNTHAQLFASLNDDRQGLEQSAQKLIAQQSQPAEKSLRSRLPDWIHQNPLAQNFEWDVEAIDDEKGVRLVPSPRCVKMTGLKAYRHTDTLDTPISILQLKLNARLEFTVKPDDEDSTALYVLSLDPSQMSEAHRKKEGGTVDVDWIKKRSLPFCDQN